MHNPQQNHQLYGSEYENALVSFFARWAINTEKVGFKEPERCTPDYLAFI
jgi:hypothetical protein